MNIFRKASAGYGLFLLWFVTLQPASAQRFDITPLVGGRFGGNVTLEQPNLPNVQGHFADGLTFGISGGIRTATEDCDACGLIEFRWMRQNTHITLTQDPLVVNPLSVSSFRPAVAMDHYLGDFTYEFNVQEAPAVKPFVMVSLGAAHISTPAAGTTRFAFGLGTGVKIFPQRRWGVRIQVEYLPIVTSAEVQRVVCTGGCIVAVTGSLLNQLQVSLGPTFRF
jgi:hypothetical protein